MTLKEKLGKLKEQQEQKTEKDWIEYKETWIKSINDLNATIMYNWFDDYNKNGLMEFSIVPTKRSDPFIGEYLTVILEITLPGNKYLVLEPVSAFTSEYDGKLEFYMRCNVYKKVNILRKLVSKIGADPKFEWIVAESYETKDHYKLSKEKFEKFIDKWLQ